MYACVAVTFYFFNFGFVANVLNTSSVHALRLTCTVCIARE